MAKLYICEDEKSDELAEFSRLVKDWDGVAVVAKHDSPTGAWIFVAIHSLQLGMAGGGCRLKRYAKPIDGLRDALRLAAGMTQKWAIIGNAFGGGKSVIALSESTTDFDRPALFHRFGAVLNDLGGIYSTGEDLGTRPADMNALAEVTSYVHGVDSSSKPAIDSGPYTAVGVMAGMKTSLEHVLSSSSFKGITILIQGLGSVGGPLARMLAAAGATLLLADVDEARLHSFASELDATIVSGEKLFETECDLFAPCAIGGVITSDVAKRIPTKIICGAANNQLESDEVSAILHQRGVLFAPDYVVNAGGAIAVPMLENGMSEAAVYERLEGVGTTLREILADAASLNESPLLGAARRVNRVLSQSAAQNNPIDPADFISGNLTAYLPSRQPKG